MAHAGEGLESATSSGTIDRFTQDIRLEAILRRRSRFGWMLTAVMLVIYFGYILLIAFRRDILARPIGEGVTSLGIPLGIGVILAGIVLTGIYVIRANHFDAELSALRQEHRA